MDHKTKADSSLPVRATKETSSRAPSRAAVWEAISRHPAYKSVKAHKRLALLGTLLAVSWVVWLPSLSVDASPQASLRAVSDRITYNVGEQVWLRLIPATPQEMDTQDKYLFSVRYAGDEKPVARRLILGEQQRLGKGEPPAVRYRALWKVPLDARTGHYDIDLRVEDPHLHKVIQEIPGISSFVVHRQVLRIVSAEAAEPYYTSGDAIACTVKIENLGNRPLSGLRLEFSERYWPWIVEQKERVRTGIAMLQDDITLEPHQRTSISAPRCTVAKDVDQPAIEQYAAVVWDHDRKNVYGIAFTPLVFVNPPGVVAPRPYPMQYVYPSLKAVNTTSYRHFHPEGFQAGAIRFDTGRTMFASGDEATLKFSVVNPTDTAWHSVSVRASLVGPDGKEQAGEVVAEGVDLNPHIAPLKQEAKLSLPENASGLYQGRVQLIDASGQTLASNALELGVNPLPKSVLLFCAHEDDDGTQMGFVRALVENHIPIRVVYFTSGEAGSCDRYYEHSCGPAEALNYGALRMEEARAALGHLGVQPEDILFLGLPDGGSGKIWYDHVRTSDPYLSVLLASDHAPYDGLFRPNLPFAREAVVEAVEKIVKKFQPDVVFTSHPPAEGHIDHIVNNYFVVKALQQLLREGAISPNLEVRVDRIFNPKTYPYTPYHYEDHTFHVSGNAMALAQEAGWFYQSQGGNRAEGNLRTWDQLPRSEGYRKVLDWKEHEGWNEKE
jgi:LmbE family N-acetylglucosaminyl deacetylase